ncbi:MAG: murein biosynthesis integral membrane protein MurJ [Alphaproteobacteria bacterium]|nr:murein biosynthesis integral membrane protein MurJ [Alphaproteobacteria bacterium]
MNLFRAATTVGGYTALSRILGLVREILMSHILGAGMIADAFIVAFKFPNFFRRFFAEGAFNAAFVPQFAGCLTTKGPAPAKTLATDVFSVMAWFLFFFVVFVLVFTPQLMPVLAPGFATTPERLDLAIKFTRITFPYILFISLSALLAGILNSLDRFAAAAAAPILLNITMIIGLLLTPNLSLEPGIILSGAVFVAGILQPSWLYYFCKRADFALSLKWPSLSPDVRRVIRLMIPGMIGAGVMQINIMVDTIFASFLTTGSVSYLYYADRLNQLPLSIFGVAIGTALLPPLSRYWRQKDFEKARETQSMALEFAMKFTVPAALGLIVLSDPLIHLIYGHGQFTAMDVANTSPTLAAYAIGLPAYVAGKVFSTTFFAMEDTVTPVKAALVSVLCNLVLNFILMRYWAHVGLALATSISAWINVVLLAGFLRHRQQFSFNKILLLSLLKILFVSCTMATFVWYLQNNFMPKDGSVFLEVISVLGFVSAGGAFYLGLGRMMGVNLLKRIH